MHRMLLLAAVLSLAPPLVGAEIRHRFLAVGESRAELHYVDQTDPSKDWNLKLPNKHRDLQLVGGNRLATTTPDGYREYNLADRSVAKEVKGFPRTMGIRRFPDGRTLLACNVDGVTVFELSPSDKVLRKATLKAAGTRVVRLTPQNTFLFGSGNQVFEANFDGKTINTITLPKGSWAYQALRKPDGHLLVAGGYHSTLFEVDAQGKVVKTIGGEASPNAKSVGLHFFGAFQVLKSGDIAVVNWTGHGRDDGAKGVQILQYDTAGKLVWKWHDPVRAGSINGVLILDDLDPAVLNDDVSSVLGPS